MKHLQLTDRGKIVVILALIALGYIVIKFEIIALPLVGMLICGGLLLNDSIVSNKNVFTFDETFMPKASHSKPRPKNLFSTKNFYEHHVIDGNILVVRTEDNVFIGVGDQIQHYDEIAKILKFNRGDQHSNLTYKYQTLQWHDGSTPPVEQQFTNHSAGLSNITKVYNCPETQEVADRWWVEENKRRQELPRFICKTKYPNSPYKVGNVVECFNEKFQLDEKMLAFCEEYPDIFERVSHKFSQSADAGIFD
jgi:hypothetical protein